MLSRLEIHNFQSLKDVQLELGLLTVIVGESNSGKSAVGRALKALASNIRGSSYITMGCKSASVSASSDDFKVTLEKSEGSSSYRVHQSGQQDREYTKLAGETPAEITKILGLELLRDGLSINFAGQHDSPFLLTSPGAAVARTLGDLTSVSTLFEAVREANRRRSASNSGLKLRRVDLTEVSAKLTEFKSLHTRVAALEAAGLSIQRMQKTAQDIVELENLSAAIDQFSGRTRVPECVDISEVLNAYQLFKQLWALAGRLGTTRTALAASVSSIAQNESRYQAAEAAVHDLLREAGRCPLCQQVVTM